MLVARINEIRQRRHAVGLNMQEVSKRAGLPPNALSRIESGKHLTHPLRAREIARALDCRVEDIFSTEREVT